MSQEPLNSRKRPRSGQPWWVLVVFLVALLVAVTAILLGFAKSPPGSAALWLEVTKAGLQLFAIALLGGSVAWAFKILDERREDRRRLDEYLASVTDELWEAYHRVKAVRRTLQAAGFERLLYPQKLVADRSKQLSQQQAAEYSEQMAVLNDAQLTLEKFNRGVETQPSLYEPEAAKIRSALREAEKYVNGILKDWENHGEDIKVGANLDEVRGWLQNLAGILGPSYALGGIGVLSESVGEAAFRIQSLRFGSKFVDPESRSQS
jgi:hypothetical protein